MNDTLVNYWRAAFDNLHASVPPSEILRSLLERYREPHRKYHSVRHLDECFVWFEMIADLLVAPGEVALALFYHDAIYNIPGPTNEVDSATLARQTLSGLGLTQVTVHSIEEMILATAHIDGGGGQSNDIKHILDIDMSILGADAGRFDEYESQIRQEYISVPDEVFYPARTKILRRFEDWECIYQTDYFRGLLERRARKNIARSLAALDRSTSPRKRE